MYVKFQNNWMKTVVCRARSGLRTEPQTDGQTHRQREHYSLSARLMICMSNVFINSEIDTSTPTITDKCICIHIRIHCLSSVHVFSFAFMEKRSICIRIWIQVKFIKYIRHMPADNTIFSITILSIFFTNENLFQPDPIAVGWKYWTHDMHSQLRNAKTCNVLALWSVVTFTWLVQ